jgi:hypothetical protein
MSRYPEMIVTFTYECGCSATRRMAYTQPRELGTEVECPTHGTTWVSSMTARGV